LYLLSHVLSVSALIPVSRAIAPRLCVGEVFSTDINLSLPHFGIVNIMQRYCGQTGWKLILIGDLIGTQPSEADELGCVNADLIII